MNNTSSHPIPGRRNFLRLLAAAGVSVAGGYALYNYAPWLDADQQSERSRGPLATAATGSTQMRELVRFATLGASGHNTQPWKFVLKDSGIEIHPDYTRRLPAVDPNNRELWISLGCALENLILGARAAGYEPEVAYPDSVNYINIRLTSGRPQGGALFDAIPQRQNTRSEYDGRPLKSADLEEVQSLPLEPGVALHFFTKATDLETVLEYVNTGNLSQFADKAFVRELISWIRFNQREALASLDGLHSRCVGSPSVPRWLGQMFVAGMKPQKQADIDAKKLRSSPGAVVIASVSDDKTAWVRTGQVYERMALAMTLLNIKSAFLNQPIEVARIRDQFQRAVGLGDFLPQTLMRFGYADAMPRSLRRPIEQVIVQG